jgi:hypothetical protein
MILLFVYPAFAGDTPSPVSSALVTATSGEVALAGEAVVPFSKLRPGDVVTVPEGGSVAVMYLAGRTETWTGPASFVVGVEASEGKKSAAPSVGAIGADLVDGLRPLPALLVRADAGTGGATRLRSGADGAPAVQLSKEEEARLAKVREAYVTLKQSPATPEHVADLYMASVLLEYDLSAEALAILVPAAERCGGCPVLEDLITSITPSPG